MTRSIRVIIIGGGISGIAQAIRLQDELGHHLDLTILERRESPGGIWRDSLWPGAGVDVPIHLYSLYSDLKPDWPERFASQADVLEYWEGLIDAHGLRRKFLFNTKYNGSAWSAESQTHTVQVTNTETGAQSELQAEVLISATGPLCKPLIPDVPGRESFAGVQFHNLRWDPTVDLEGKRVAVIGNGSSGIQLIPGVAALPGVTLTHYVRSGGYFIPKVQHQYTALEKFMFRWVPGWIHIHRFNLLLAHDRLWNIRTFADDGRRDGFEESLIDYLREKTPPEYFDALKPNYPIGAKRTALDYGWLDSLHRSNVSLVSQKITGVEGKGIQTADGELHEHDVIIWATGSDVAQSGLGACIGLRGEEGRELREYWNTLGGPQAHTGMAVPGFPNYFIVIGPNATAGSWGWTLGRQSTAIARVVRGLLDYGLSSVQPKADVYEAYNVEIQAKLENCSAGTDQTTNWWRVGENKKITVINPRSGMNLWWNTLATRWDEWDAVRLEKSKNEKASVLEHVDVAAIQRRRRATTAVLVAGGLGAAAWFYTNKR